MMNETPECVLPFVNGNRPDIVGILNGNESIVDPDFTEFSETQAELQHVLFAVVGQPDPLFQNNLHPCSESIIMRIL